MVEEIKAAAWKLPRGIVFSLLAIIALALDNIGYVHVGAFIADPSTAQAIETAITAVLTLLAGVARGISEDKHK